MGLDDLVHDAIPVNQPYAGLGAEAYDVWMPPSGDDPDVEVYRRSIERGAGPALELGCGNGRLLVGYARAGFDVEGVDSSADMLAICASHGRAAGLDLMLPDAAAQTEHVLNRHELWSAGGELITTYIRRHRLRWWTREQLEGMLRTCDYVDVRSHGGSDEFITVGRSA